MKVLIIDNFDSFTFNLFQYVGEILKEQGKEPQVIVKRNNELSLKDIEELSPDKIIISPGPGDPSDTVYFGVCGEVLTTLSHKIPTLGVCLGLQGMAHYYGGKVVRAALPMHGKVSKILHDEQGVFASLPQGLEVMRYHSLIAEKESLPSCFEITAWVEENPSEIMGIRHKTYPIEGVQFHPESFATEAGREMVKNFLLKEL